MIRRPGYFVAPTVVEEPESGDRTQRIPPAVMAAVHVKRVSAVSDAVHTIHELKTTKVLTLGLLGLALTMLTIFAGGNGWWSQGVQMMTAASVLYVGAFVFARANPDSGRISRLRKTVVVSALVVGIVFTLVGGSMGIMQYVYDAVHATGLI